MNLIDLIRGIGTGYLVRLLQVAASVLVVPFLLQDDVLGIESYGRIFAIISTLSFVNLLTDGLRVSYSRSISQALSLSPADVARCVGAGLKVMVILVLVIGGALFAASGLLLELLGIPGTAEWRAALGFAIVHVVVENALYVFQSYALARGRLDFVNQVLAFEVILRNVAMVTVFLLYGGSASCYMAIFSAGVVLRCVGFVLLGLIRHREDFRGMWRAPIRESWDAIRYSFSVSGASLHFFVLQKLSIPVVNRLIGSAEAGLLSIAMNTITNNASQVLFSVVRPILVPIASRFDFRAMDASQKRFANSLDATYMICVNLFMTPLAVVLGVVVNLWLGPEFEELVLPSQVLIMGAAIQVSFNLRRAMLVSQGLAPSMARISLVLTAAAVVAICYFATQPAGWVAVAIAISVFNALNSLLAHGYVFESLLLSPRDPGHGLTWRLMILVVVCQFGAVWLAMNLVGEIVPTLIALVCSVLVVVGLSHVLLLKFPDLLELLRFLRQNARESIFSSTETPSSDPGGAVP